MIAHIFLLHPRLKASIKGPSRCKELYPIQFYRKRVRSVSRQKSEEEFYMRWITLLCIVSLTSCFVVTGSAQKEPPSNQKMGIPPDVYTLGSAMDRLASDLEEWGSMQMSAPLLVLPDTNFNFNIQRGTSNYFFEAKNEIQGAAAFSEQTFQSLNAALQVQNDPTVTSAFDANLKQFQLQSRNAEESQSLLRQLDQIQFSDGLKTALAETNPATRQAMLLTLRSNLTAAAPPTPSAGGVKVFL
jgi:hypothetical protein